MLLFTLTALTESLTIVTVSWFEAAVQAIVAVKVVFAVTNPALPRFTLPNLNAPPQTCAFVVVTLSLSLPDTALSSITTLPAAVWFPAPLQVEHSDATFGGAEKVTLIVSPRSIFLAPPPPPLTSARPLESARERRR